MKIMIFVVKITIFEDFRNTLETSESFTVGDLRPPKKHRTFANFVLYGL